MAKSGVTLNWGGFDRAIQKAVGNLPHDKGELLDAIGETLVSGTQKRFHEGKAPDGQPWKPVRRGGSPLRDTGQLRGSIEYATTADSVLVGSNLPQALIHQKGGEVKAKKKKALHFKTPEGNDVFVKSVNIPARPYLGINDEDMKVVRGVLKEWFRQVFRG
jgi:phage virion morphogenesis protein